MSIHLYAPSEKNEALERNVGICSRYQSVVSGTVARFRRQFFETEVDCGD